MKKFALLSAALLSFGLIASPAATAHANEGEAAAPIIAETVKASEGDMVYDSEGRRLGRAVKVLDDGSVVVIVKGKAVRVAAHTLSNQEGKLSTSLTKRELSRM